MNHPALARERCANFSASGCLGISIARNGMLGRFAPEGVPCAVLAGQECAYFRACVLAGLKHGRCECGEERPRGCERCPACALKRRRELSRARTTRHRTTCNALA